MGKPRLIFSYDGPLTEEQVREVVRRNRSMLERIGLGSKVEVVVEPGDPGGPPRNLTIRVEEPR